MFEAMRVATHVSRVINETQDRWIGAGEAFDAATTGGARLCGWGDSHRPDRAALPRRSSSTRSGRDHLSSTNNLLQQIVYCEDGTGVESVMIGGAWVYRDRRHTRIDLAALRSKANDAALDLAERIGRCARPRSAWSLSSAVLQRHTGALPRRGVLLTRRLRSQAPASQPTFPCRFLPTS